MLTAAHIHICPQRSKTKKENNINMNWCAFCVSSGEDVCCEACPNAVHKSCLQTSIDPNKDFIYEECKPGRLPLYGEVVWAKFNNFRRWPSITLPPTEIPQFCSEIFWKQRSRLTFKASCLHVQRGGRWLWTFNI